jgi:hypothetical protein
MSFKNASEYVISFISKYGDDDLLNKWNNNEFKKFFKEKKEKSSIKKNKSSYLFFCDEERDVIKKENLGLTNKQIIGELAIRWGLLKDYPDKIEKYTLRAKEDKERYQTEIKNISVNENIGENVKTKSKKTKKEKSNIKKNKSSYLFFCDEERLKIKKEKLELSNKEIICELANRWKNVKDDPKKIEKFVKLAESDKNRYENEKKNIPSVNEDIEVVSEEIPDVIENTPEIVDVVVEKPKKKTKKIIKK